LLYGRDVTFHGYTDMEKIWDQVGMLCMPSRYEGLPMAALEAMSRGIPVLASEVGDLPYLIEQDKSGWTFPISELDKFCNAIRDWQSMSPDQRSVMAIHARKQVSKNYSEAAIIPQLEQVYCELG
ncbi:MAG: glycosyltransferase family 4 protein, partial [Alphaproteobacteria bacterium]|nr:glycosyltransferase family 4 protein [Alphaproteobacteria bacterium]